MSEQGDRMKELVLVARAARVDTDLLVECIQRRIIVLDGDEWDDSAVDQARRVRRLMSLGVNLQGMEVIMQMRQRTLRLQREMEALRAELAALQRRHEEEIGRLLRELSREV